MKRFQRFAYLCCIAVSAVLALSAMRASADQSCLGTVSTNTTLDDNITQPNHGPCIYVTAGVVLNLNGYSIFCDRAAGCSEGIVNTGNGTTIKKGGIKARTGDWERGITNLSTAGLTVTNVTIDGSLNGILNPTTKVENSVIKNIEDHCIITDSGTMPTNGQITQNFCDSDWVGIQVAGPASGTTAKVLRNYVRAATGAGIAVTNSGIVAVTQNIIDEGSPFIDEGANTTRTENVCDDAGDCPAPDSDFNLTLDFDP